MAPRKGDDQEESAPSCSSLDTEQSRRSAFFFTTLVLFVVHRSYLLILQAQEAHRLICGFALRMKCTNLLRDVRFLWRELEKTGSSLSRWATGSRSRTSTTGGERFRFSLRSSLSTSMARERRRESPKRKQANTLLERRVYLVRLHSPCSLSDKIWVPSWVQSLKCCITFPLSKRHSFVL